MKTNKILIVSGGKIEYDWAVDYVKKNNFDYIIAIDKGAEFLFEAQINPDLIYGDLDSAKKDVLSYFWSENDKKDGIIKSKLNKHENDTDTQAGIKIAVDHVIHGMAEDYEIYIIGGTGTRLDHVLGNIHGMLYAHERGIKAFLVDKNNKIYFAYNKMTISKTGQHGKYVSLIPISEKVTGITLEGFEYDLLNYELTNYYSRAISNEIVSEFGKINFIEGQLLVVESRD